MELWITEQMLDSVESKTKGTFLVRESGCRQCIRNDMRLRWRTGFHVCSKLCQIIAEHLGLQSESRMRTL